MKRLLALFLSVLMVFSLAACTTSEQPKQNEPASTEPAEPAASGEAVDPYADYPNKTIEVIVPYGTGGTHDLVARMVTPYFVKNGYDVRITNIAGASGMTGTNDFLSRPSDGYTLIMMSPEVLAAQYVIGNIDYEVWHDLAYLGCWVRDSRVIVVDADSPYNTLDDLIQDAKAHPGELNWEANGPSGAGPMSAFLMWEMMGIDCNYVPSEDVAEGLATLMGGHVDCGCYFLSEVVAYVEAGEMKALAVSNPERSALLPDIPTLTELGFTGVITEADLTRCWAVKGDTPPEIIEKLRETFKTVWDDPELQAEFLAHSANASYMTGDQLQEYGDLWKGLYTQAFEMQKQRNGN